jgi:hypothetical protein
MMRSASGRRSRRQDNCALIMPSTRRTTHLWARAKHRTPVACSKRPTGTPRLNFHLEGGYRLSESEAHLGMSVQDQGADRPVARRKSRLVHGVGVPFHRGASGAQGCGAAGNYRNPGTWPFADRKPWPGQ